MQKRLEIFCCYAREDHSLLLALIKHLSALQRTLPIDIWYDAHISPGRDWEHEIKKHLNQSEIILLLVSPDFMASDYCYSKELQQAMQREKWGQARVIPIILRPVDWENTPLAKLQALPTNAEPIVGPTWHSLDEAFFSVMRGIRLAVEELSTTFQNIPAERDNFHSPISRKEPEKFSRPLRRQRPARQTQMHYPQDNSRTDQQNVFISQEISSPTAEQTSTEPSSLSAAYETLRKNIETKIGTDKYKGAVVVIASPDQVKKVVHLQMADRYRNNWDPDYRMEYARTDSYTIGGHTITAAVFEGVWQGEYAVWIDKREAVTSVVCPGETILLELYPGS